MKSRTRFRASGVVMSELAMSGWSMRVMRTISLSVNGTSVDDPPEPPLFSISMSVCPARTRWPAETVTLSTRPLAVALSVVSTSWPSKCTRITGWFIATVVPAATSTVTIVASRNEPS
jgi:hypothetical protein